MRVTVLLAIAAVGAALGQDVVTNRAGMGAVVRVAGDATNAAPAPLVFLDRSYYTTEETACVVCQRPSSGDMATGNLRVKDAQGKTLIEVQTAGAQAVAIFRITDWKSGRHTLAVEFVCPGQPAFVRELALIKRSPGAAGEWKIDQVNRVVLHNGRPFFVVGLFWTHEGNPNPYELFAARPDFLKRLREMHFNVLVPWQSWWSEGNDRPERNKINALKEYVRLVEQTPGLYALWPLTRMGKHNLNRWGFLAGSKSLPRVERDRNYAKAFAEDVPAIEESLRVLKASPGIMGYYSFDGPTLPSEGSQYIQGQELYRRVHAEDGYRLVFTDMSYGAPEAVDERMTGWVDIFCRNTFVTPEALTFDTFDRITWITWHFMELGQPVRKPFWAIFCAETFGEFKKRPLLPREHFMQAYLALIHGATGIIYFNYPHIYHQLTFDALTEVGRQMETLGPICLTPAVPQTVEYTPVGFLPNMKGRYPEVHVALRRNPAAGGYVLLAVNSRPWTVTAAMKLSCLPRAGEIGRLFGNEKYVVTEGSFHDRFAPHETRAYVIAAATNTSEPIAIHVDCVSHRKEWVKEEFIGHRGRIGPRNLIPNPGFEQATMPGWPDYFHPLGRANPPVGTPNAGWGQDDREPYEGKYCLRMVKNWSEAGGISTMFTCLPEHEADTPYVFSAYMKANRDSVEVSMSGLGMGQKNRFTLTTQWQRYCIRGIVPSVTNRSGSGRDAFCISLRTGTPDAPGTVWIDAVQLEQGETPTPFQD